MRTIVNNGDRLNLDWKGQLSRWLDSAYFVPCLLVAFVAIWTTIFSIAYYGSDLHKDTLETWSVGRVLAWGFWKHPPLMGWVANIWTQVFPLTDWSFRLLSMVNAALALYAVDLIARRFVDKDKRILILLLLLLTPTYQFHAENFNANSVLLVVWPLATYCFLRSYEDRTVFWSIAASITRSFS
jgi:4-amino-4-deoxy-L-arabinose transferase-like glycosyltransferase